MAIKLTEVKIGDQTVTVKVDRKTGIFKAQMYGEKHEHCRMEGLLDTLSEAYKDNIQPEWLHVVRVDRSEKSSRVDIMILYAAQIEDDLYLNSEPSKFGAQRFVHLRGHAFSLPFGWSDKEDGSWTWFLPLDDLAEVNVAAEAFIEAEKQVKACYFEQMDIFTKRINELANARRNGNGKV